VVLSLLGVVLAGCESGPAPVLAAHEEPLEAAYGVMTVHFAGNRIVRDSAYPPGVYDVPLDAGEALAFDNDSARTTICARLDRMPFELNGNVKHWRFQCDTSWNSRGVVFMKDPQISIRRAEMLGWRRLAGEMPLARPASVDSNGLHSYAQIATPGMLDGSTLVSAAWFSGQYPPLHEFDALRGDSITFGHYVIRDRVLFIGQSATRPVTYLLRANDAVGVREALEWAFFPEDASQKNVSRFDALYELPTGYLIRALLEHDHEGFGVDEVATFFLHEEGQWRLFARAERFRAY
jgi:hypothetical protein